MGYSRILAHYPYVVIGGVIVLAATCLVVTITTGEMPDFSDPQAGFEVRGTELSNRFVTWENLLDSTQTDIGRRKSKGRTPHSGRGNGTRRYGRATRQDPWFFCGDTPGMTYARVAYKSTDGSDLFSLRHLLDMCSLESNSIHLHPSYSQLCIAQHPEEAHCCKRSWSLGNYIALLRDKTNCSDITQEDVGSVRDLLERCSGYYRNMTLKFDCERSSSDKCKSVPTECKQHNAVYQILHYITDVEFTTESGHLGPLRYAIAFLPMSAGKDTVPIFEFMTKKELQIGTTAIGGVNFGIKNILFNEYLQGDTMWLGVALFVILLCMWLYTTSFFITGMTLLSILLSLEISYFLYTLVFEIKFFPFMNLMTIVILIGVGADDMFIYTKVWSLAKSEKNNGTLEKIISDTIKHATLSMFVTSFTTAAALYTNYISHVTALRCFAIYSGTAILANFLLMVTWIPATIVMYDKWCSNYCVCYSPDIYTPKRGICYYICKIPYKAYLQIADWSRIFFEKLLPCIVVKLRFVWVIFLGLMGIGGLIIIFYKPRFKLPSSHEFQVFSPQHLFEIYDFKLKDEFYFEKAAGQSMYTLPMTFVFGVEPRDNGSYLAPREPNNHGALVRDETFNIAAEESQIWLRSFCRKIRAHPFYKSSPGLQLTNCFIESLENFARRKCILETDICCGYSSIPIPEHKFMECVGSWAPLLTRTKARFPHNKYAGLRYSKDSREEIVAAVIQFNSKVPFSYKYDEINNYYSRMSTWVEYQVETTAPSGMRRGWFISELEFYSLQKSILEGAPLSVGASVAVALVVTFITTLNVLVSLYAFLSISSTISVTIAVLTLLGWQLNILESVTLTISVGLSIDFTLHYGVAYRLSPDLDREMRVICSTARMGSPVTMAAATTFLAGAMMTPATVLAYRQLGIFLMLIMTISWVYSTLFFQSLLRLIGPQGGFSQFHWPSSNCCSSSQRHHVDKTVYALSESTLSSSSVGYQNHSTVTTSEIHELESLTECEAEELQERLRQPPPNPRTLATNRAPHKQKLNNNLTSAGTSGDAGNVDESHAAETEVMLHSEPRDSSHVWVQQ
ncbi:unnamed protein product [Owenia fusiformis]|uniref:Uncharacterized protein n=1 Tax=Owenia fusiformis TaxID=6347 RepID=A0A8J1U3F0_OWEFU|nr:unnamed protein product [Owenia fusiformis]